MEAANSASFSTAVSPILSVVLQEEDPFCVNNSGGALNADVDLDAEAVWANVPNLEWSADCGGCISGNGVFDPGVAGVGTHEVTVSYDESLGCSVSGTIDVVVAPAVDASIDEIQTSANRVRMRCSPRLKAEGPGRRIVADA